MRTTVCAQIYAAVIPTRAVPAPISKIGKTDSFSIEEAAGKSMERLWRVSARTVEAAQVSRERFSERRGGSLIRTAVFWLVEVVIWKLRTRVSTPLKVVVSLSMWSNQVV